MSEQIQPQTEQIQEVTFYEKNELLEERVKEILEPITTPEFKELIMIPRDANVPIYKMLRDAPYKLSKEFTKFYSIRGHYLLYVSKDLLGEATEKRRMAIVKVARHEISLFFITKNLVTYKYLLDWGEIERIFNLSSLKGFTTDGGQNLYDLPNDDKMILSRFIGVNFNVLQYTKIPGYYGIKVETLDDYILNKLWLMDAEEEIAKRIKKGKIYAIRGIKKTYYIKPEDDDEIIIDNYRIKTYKPLLLIDESIVGEINNDETEDNKNYYDDESYYDDTYYDDDSSYYNDPYTY